MSKARHVLEGWESRPLLEVVSLPKGQVSPLVEPYRSMVLVAPDHIESGTGRLLEKRTATEQGAISGKYRFAPGDVVYSKIRPYLRKVFLADFHGLSSADMYPLTPGLDMDPGFLLAVLLARDFSEFAVSVSARSGIPKVNRQELAEYSVALPPLDEQRAIAAVLGDADELIDHLRDLLHKKANLRTAVAQSLLTGRRRLAGYDSEWERRRIDEIAHVDPQNLGSRTPPDFAFSYVSLENVERGHLLGYSREKFAKAPSRARRQIHANDVLVGTVRPNLKSHLLFTEEGGSWICSTGFAVVRCHPDLADARFIFEQVMGGDVEAQIDALLTGSNYPAINSGDVRDLVVPVPPLVEQQAIATILADMDAEIRALTARIQKTSYLREAIAQRLLSGATRVHLAASKKVVA